MNKLEKQRLYKKAFALLERANKLLRDARAKHEQATQKRAA